MHGTSAIEVSRCYDSRDFEGTLFFGISSRGRTSRVIEAAMRVNALGKNSKTGRHRQLQSQGLSA